MKFKGNVSMKRFAKMNLSIVSQGVSLYLSNFGRKIRNLFSNELKNFESMKALKNRIIFLVEFLGFLAAILVSFKKISCFYHLF